MKLRNRRTIVAPGSDTEAPKSWGARATMAAYFVAVAALLGSLLFFVGERAVFFKVRGQVNTEKTVLGFTRGGRIVELRAVPGDSVREGELLAWLEPERACSPTVDPRVAREERDRRVDSLRLVIAEERLREERARLAELVRRRALELDHAGPAEHRRVAGEIARLEDERRLLRLEMEVASGTVAPVAASAADPRCERTALYAPFAGTIYSRHQERFQVVGAGDPVLTLEPRDPQSWVTAYLEPDEVDAVASGTRVRVEFPDGSTEPGIVHAVYSSARPFARLERNGYQNAPSELLAEIRPADPARGAAWRRFDRFDVTIRGGR